MISTSEIEAVREALKSCIEEACLYLLPASKKIGSEMKCGGVDGGPGNSLGVCIRGEKVGVWHDRATGEGGDFLDLWMLNRGLSFKEAVAEAAGFCRMPRPEGDDGKVDPANFIFNPPPDRQSEGEIPAYRPTAPTAKFDWDSFVNSLTADKLQELCQWRGYSKEFAEWLKDSKLIGIVKDCFAFPVHDANGVVVAAHYRGKEKGWFYYPRGAATAPLVIGDPTTAIHTLAFESQWDAFAVLDKLQAHKPENAGAYAAFITRSATSNTDISKLTARNLTLLPQNDPRDKAVKTTGRTPAEEWSHRMMQSKPPSMPATVFETPAKHKDANDWIRDEQPDEFQVFQQVVESARNPILAGVKTTREIQMTDTSDDPNALIGHKRRFLCKGGSWMIVGPSGIGKSTLITGLVLHAGAGIPWHGITFRRPMKVLVIQAENDDGDIKEMLEGAIAAVGFDASNADHAGSNIKWKRETSRTGADFCEWLEVLIRETSSDLVVIDPLLSFIGDDVSQQKVASTFFRNWLQPVLDRTGAIAVMIHHTGKTPTDSKSRQNWSESDFAYLGIGSSEMTNWPRAVSVLVPHGVDSGMFKFLIAKRGSRAGMVNRFTGEKSTSIMLKHSAQGLGWSQCEPADATDDAPRGGGRKQKVPPDVVMKRLGPDTHSKRKDHLVADLILECSASERAVREKVDALILAGRIHVAQVTPREGGGHPYEWLRAGPHPTGNNQPETSD